MTTDTFVTKLYIQLTIIKFSIGKWKPYHMNCVFSFFYDHYK